MKHLLKCAIVLSLFFTSTIFAQTWVSLNGPQIASGVKDISVTSNGSTLYIADGSYVLRSTNSGTAWAVTQQSYESPLLVLVKPNDSTKVLAARNGELRYNDQGGAGSGWTTISGLQDLTPLRLVAAVNDNTVMLLGRVWVEDNNSIWRSDNSGANWSKVTDFISETDIHDFAPYPNNTSGHGAGIMWAAGSSDASPSPSFDKTEAAEIRGLWISENYGQTWPNTKLGGYNVRSVAIVSRTSPTNYHVYAAVRVEDRDTLMKLTHHGNNDWTPVFFGADEIRLVRVNVSTTSIFLATNNGVYRSTDAYSTNGGGTWSKLTNLPDNDVKSIAIGSGSTVFAGTANSLYKSTNNGDTWTEVGKMNVDRGDTEARAAQQ